MAVIWTAQGLPFSPFDKLSRMDFAKKVRIPT